MKKLFAVLVLSFVSTVSNAAEYKCYAAKYPTDMEHFFTDGYVLLNVKQGVVNFKYYYVNTVAHETTLEIDVNYKLGKVNTGKGSLAGMVSSSLLAGKKGYPGDEINTIHFDQALVSNTSSTEEGLVGKFTFPGHGYSYDWNLCYRR
jgi:hypothetical protein